MAYWGKTTSLNKSEILLKADDDIWNDKDTDDFIRYQKFELFDFANFTSKLIC